MSPGRLWSTLDFSSKKSEKLSCKHLLGFYAYGVGEFFHVVYQKIEHKKLKKMRYLNYYISSIYWVDIEQHE